MNVCGAVYRVSLAFLALGALSLSGAPKTQASIIFAAGNQSGEQNVLFGSGDIGSVASGLTDSNITVIFTSRTNQSLFQKAQGLADIENGTDPGEASLTSIAVSLPGYTFQSLTLNLQNGTGTAHIEAIGTSDRGFNYALGNGQNFFTVTATDGDTLSAVQVTQALGSSDFGFAEAKQPRVSSAIAASETDSLVSTPAAVPEPGSMSIIGTALLALGFAARRWIRR